MSMDQRIDREWEHVLFTCVLPALSFPQGRQNEPSQKGLDDHANKTSV